MDSNESLQQQESDHEEELRLENDIMKLKLQAEFGARFTDIDGDVPPEMEQQFLSNVYEFEKAWEKQEATTVAKLLGNPVFTPFEELPVDKQEDAWHSVLDAYNVPGITVDFTHDYPLEVKYRFATEELPLHETVFINMPGMMLGFIYEEFHPNHAADMEDIARQFIEGWFSRDVEKCLEGLNNELILENGTMISKEQLSKKMTHLFESFESFDETDFFIAETSYDKQETEQDDDDFSLGYVEGGIRWKAHIELGGMLPFAGPYKLYMQLKFGYWSIIYFVLPGWKW